MRSSLPVSKVIDCLFDGLYSAPNASSALSYSEALSRISVVYPVVWADTLMLQFSQLSPSSDAHKWVCLLTHISVVSIPACLGNISELVDLCVTSIHSVDVDIRRSSAQALRSISLHSPGIVLQCLLTSLDLFSVNFQIFDLLMNITASDDDEILMFLIHLLTEESDLVLSQYLSAVCQTIVSVVTRSPSSPHILTLWELVSPLCWSQTLIASSSSAFLGDAVRASAALLCALPSVPVASLHSLQTALMRSAIHARSREQLIAAIDAIHILLLAKKLLFDQETVSSFVPILIDLGIAMGLTLTQSLSVQECMLKLWSDMSDQGMKFIHNRLAATQLSLADQYVCLVFLAARTGLNHDALLETLVATRPTEAYIQMAMLDLVQSTTSVPVMDWVLALSTMSDATSTPSQLRQYWFENKRHEENSLLGPSMADVCAKAQNLVRKLSAVSAHFQTRLVIALRRLPVSGLGNMLAVLKPIREDLAGEIFAWAYIQNAKNEELDPSLAAQVVAQTCLSHRVLKKLDSEQIRRAVSLFVKTVPFLPDAVGEEIVCSCEHAFFYDEITRFGEAIGSFAKYRFPEFLRIMAFLKRKQKRGVLSQVFGIPKKEEFWFCLARTALGYSAMVAFPTHIVPIAKTTYIDPCIATLRFSTSLAELKCTLVAIYQFCGSHKNDDFLPILFEKTFPLSPELLLAISAAADAASTLSPGILSSGIERALSYVVEAGKEPAVLPASKCIKSLLNHSPNALGLLARMAQQAGMNGPNSEIRVLLLETIRPVSRIDDQEFLLAVIPRLRDPATRTVAEKFWPCDDILQTVSENIMHSGDQLSPFLALAVHNCVTDACQPGALFLLDLVNRVLPVAQPSEGPRLAAIMLQHVDSVADTRVRRKLLECIHTLSGLHLASTLQELISARESFTSGEIALIVSIVKVRRLCVGFFNFVGALMVNPRHDQHRCISCAAARALLVAFAVDEVHALVKKHLPALVGTVWLFGQVHGPAAVELMSKCLPNHKPEDDLVASYIEAGGNATDLAQFLLPFATPLLAQLVPHVSDALLVAVKDVFVKSENMEGLCAVWVRVPTLIDSAAMQVVMTQLTAESASGSVACALRLVRWTKTFLDWALVTEIVVNHPLVFTEILSLILAQLSNTLDINSDMKNLRIEIQVRKSADALDCLAKLPLGGSSSVLAKYFERPLRFSPAVVAGAAEVALTRGEYVEAILNLIKTEAETRNVLLAVLGKIKLPKLA